MRRRSLLVLAAGALLAGCATSRPVAPMPGLFPAFDVPRFAEPTSRLEPGGGARVEGVVRAAARRQVRTFFVAPPEAESTGDPLGEAFTRYPAGFRSPMRFTPSTGKLDLGRAGAATLYGRGWKRGGLFGVGLGLTLPIAPALSLGAEIGIDPRKGPGAGGIVVVMGLSVRL